MAPPSGKDHKHNKSQTNIGHHSGYYNVTPELEDLPRLQLKVRK